MKTALYIAPTLFLSPHFQLFLLKKCKSEITSHTTLQKYEIVFDKKMIEKVRITHSRSDS